MLEKIEVLESQQKKLSKTNARARLTTCVSAIVGLPAAYSAFVMESSPASSEMKDYVIGLGAVSLVAFGLAGASGMQAYLTNEQIVSESHTT